MDTTGKLSSKHEHGTLNTNRSRMAAAERVFGASGLASPASVLARGRDQSWGLGGLGSGCQGLWSKLFAVGTILFVLRHGAIREQLGQGFYWLFRRRLLPKARRFGVCGDSISPIEPL